MSEPVTQEHAVEETNSEESVVKFKKRMLLWPNPVEYVNNMYGCHPDHSGTDYFRKVFAK